jgi:hypothetical protein
MTDVRPTSQRQIRVTEQDPHRPRSSAMNNLINSRAMAQTVAFDLMADEARRAAVRRRDRAARRTTASAEPTPVAAPSARTVRPWWRLTRALHLAH